MTVAEMIAELQKLPLDAEVVIEGYDVPMELDEHTEEDMGALFKPDYIEALQNEELGVRAVIWATLIRPEAEPMP